MFKNDNKRKNWNIFLLDSLRTKILEFVKYILSISWSLLYICFLFLKETLSCFSTPPHFSYHIPKGGARNGNKRHYFITPQKKRFIPRRISHQGHGHKTSGIPLGKRRDDPQYRDIKKLLSKEFDVSINKLLGKPRQLICQCSSIYQL